jgi:hypothetical protein
VVLAPAVLAAPSRPRPRGIRGGGIGAPSGLEGFGGLEGVNGILDSTVKAVVIALVAPAERFIAFGWQAISDAAWSEFACMLTYKQGWRGGQTTSAERCFPSSKTCSKCGTVKATMSLAERTFGCDACGLSLDRDLNAAINLATWAERHSIGADAQVPEARGPVPNAHRGDGSGPRTRAGESSSNDVGTQTQTHAA